MSGLLRRLPWAGLLVVPLLFLVDRLVLDPPAESWRAIAARTPAIFQFPASVARARAALLEARRPETNPRIVVLGTSRAGAAILPNVWQRRLDGGQVVKLTHPLLGLYELRAYAEAVADLQPQVVVVLLSEFDTHQPFRISPLKVSTNLAALADAIDVLGPAQSWSQRTRLLREAVAVGLVGYRMRDAWFAAGLHRLRQAPLPAPRPPPDDILVQDGQRRSFDADTATRRVRQRFPDLPRATAEQLVEQHSRLTAGRHVEVHRELLERTLTLWTARGIRVLLVEGPVDPLAHDFYDAEALGAEYVDIATELAEIPGVEVAWRPEVARLEKRHFRDLSHLSLAGADLYTRRLWRRHLAPLLEPAAPETTLPAAP